MRWHVMICLYGDYDGVLEEGIFDSAIVRVECTSACESG
jgi:hypothetical protein